MTGHLERPQIYDVTFGGANTPQGHATGPNAIPGSWKARVDAVAAAMIRLTIDVLGVQEYGPLLHTWWERRQGFSAAMGCANTTGKGGRKTGNGQVWRPGTVQALHVRALRFWWKPRRHLPSKVAQFLTFVEILYRHCATDSLFAVIDGHIPRAGDADEKTRRRINRGVLREAKRLWHRFGIPVVVILDKNTHNVTEYLAAGFRIVAQHGPDVVLVLGAVNVTGQTWADASGFSDHDRLVAGTCTFAQTDQANAETRLRLPSRSRWFHRQRQLHTI